MRRVRLEDLGIDRATAMRRMRTWAKHGHECGHASAGDDRADWYARVLPAAREDVVTAGPGGAVRPQTARVIVGCWVTPASADILHAGSFGDEFTPEPTIRAAERLAREQTELEARLRAAGVK